jgi:hypothetical protein
MDFVFEYISPLWALLHQHAIFVLAGCTVVVSLIVLADALVPAKR